MMCFHKGSLILLCLSHMKAIFQSFFFYRFLKTRCFVLKFSPQNADNRILHCFRALKFQNFLGQNAPGQTLPSPSRRGLAAPCCWNSQLLYSNLLATSIFIETPVWGTFFLHQYDSMIISFCVRIEYSASMTQKHALDWTLQKLLLLLIIAKT